jgi:hypothetical protein
MTVVSTPAHPLGSSAGGIRPGSPLVWSWLGQYERQSRRSYPELADPEALGGDVSPDVLGVAEAVGVAFVDCCPVEGDGTVEVMLDLGVGAPSVRVLSVSGTGVRGAVSAPGVVGVGGATVDVWREGDALGVLITATTGGGVVNGLGRTSTYTAAVRTNAMLSTVVDVRTRHCIRIRKSWWVAWCPGLRGG